MNEIKTVTLTLTQQCNLNCSYCYERHKSPRKMDAETAKKIIDYELKNSEDFPFIEFDFFGGEPFLVFDLVQELTEFILENKGNRECIIFATTNGTLIHGAIQEWLTKHAGTFVCGLSLDGTREMHNVNRSNSYDSIDLDFFLKTYPQQEIKMTVSKETLSDFAQGVIELHNKGFRVSCNLAYGIDWSALENETILARELNKLVDFYLSNPQVEPCSMLETGIDLVGLNQEYVSRYCGAGFYMRTYDVDGTNYPCQFFMPLSVGKEKAEDSLSIEFPSSIIPDSLLDGKCRNCVIRSSCPNCFGSNYASTGNIYKRDDNMCRLTKIIFKARSYFRAKQWELGQLQASPDDLDVLLRAIVKIQEELEV